MTSFWAVLEMQSIMKNLLRWATRVLRPSIVSQISRWEVRLDTLGPGYLDQMFETREQVALDRKPLAKVPEERAYWSGKYCGHKRPADEDKDIQHKKSRRYVHVLRGSSAKATPSTPPASPDC